MAADISRRAFLTDAVGLAALGAGRERGTTKAVWRGAGAHRPFVRSPVELDRLAIETSEGRSLSWDEALLKTFTDGLVVVHRGKLVFERYFAHCDAHARHATMSATKSLVGTLAQELVLCGPTRFMADVQDGLEANGVASERIHTESFGPPG